jgi:hypothetical protein
VIGVCCGTAVFAAEHRWAAGVFLANQRFTPGVVWMMKIAIWYAIGIAATAVLELGGLIRLSFLDPVWRELLNTNSWVSYSAWLALGFAVGQFFAMVITKNLPAFVCSLFVCILLTWLWVPFLASGAVPTWCLFILPLLLLVITRLTYWPWVSQRPAYWSAFSGTAACLVLMAILGGNLWFRGMPLDSRTKDKFDPQDFLTDPPDDEARH